MKSEKKIIIIEDDADINNLIAYNLKKEGYAVEQVFDGLEARNKLRNGQFNIVILDLMLPGIDGFDICKDFKGSRDFAKTFIIVVSARSDHQDKLYAHLLGADYYLTKPFSVLKLISIVKDLEADMEREFEVSGVRNFTRILP